jgi:hypothetical protein
VPNANYNGEIGIGAAADTWEAYDNLPPDFRAIVRNASFNVSCKGSMPFFRQHSLAELKQRLDQITKENALACYGPDHPQAHD